MIDQSNRHYQDSAQPLFLTEDRVEHCEVCNIYMRTRHKGELIEESGDNFCLPCLQKLPASLLKAISDPFDYAIGLRTGLVIRFSEARIQGEWVHLLVAGTNRPVGNGDDTYNWERGIDVRLTEIVWCADAPIGS